MKKNSTIFLRVVILLIAIGALLFLLGEPHFEGRNVNATLSEIYFNDPFLVLAYTASIAFFVALFQAFKLLGNIGRNETFSESSVKALRKIRYCALVLMGFALGAEAYLFIVRPEEDIAGGVFMGLLMIAISGTVASVAHMFEKTLQKAVDIKSENDLTI